MSSQRWLVGSQGSSCFGIGLVGCTFVSVVWLFSDGLVGRWQFTSGGLSLPYFSSGLDLIAYPLPARLRSLGGVLGSLEETWLSASHLVLVALEYVTGKAVETLWLAQASSGRRMVGLARFLVSFGLGGGYSSASVLFRWLCLEASFL